jgi:hypothetical protein
MLSLPCTAHWHMAKRRARRSTGFSARRISAGPWGPIARRRRCAHCFHCAGNRPPPARPIKALGGRVTEVDFRGSNSHS